MVRACSGLALFLIVYPSAVAAVLYQMVGFLNSRNWVSLAMLIFMICTIGFLTVYTVHKMMAIKRERREAIPHAGRKFKI